MSALSRGEQITIHQRPVELLQNLIRFNTTNPPGNEGECIGYINHLLNIAGIETTIIARDPAHPNLIARLSGRGNVPPLLLYGHVDVVTAENQVWKHPWFGGEIAEGYVWGRGALDMKGGVAMMLAAFLRAKADGFMPPGDIVLAILSDEEGLGGYGAQYLVENHADLLKGIRYALGEFGGFTFYVGRRRFYPIMVAEKQWCSIKASVCGMSGHPSVPIRNGAMAKLAGLLNQLNRYPLPTHVTPVARHMIQTIASTLPFPSNLIIYQLLNPVLTNPVLKLLGNKGQVFEPLLHNVVNASLVHSGDKSNVVPMEISVELINFLLPGYSPEELITELHHLLGSEVKLEVIRYDPCPAEPDMGLFDTLADILCEADPGSKPVPMLLPAITDGRFFSRLGIQTYGLLPMNLPAEFNFTETMHAADERIPVEAVAFGTDAIYKALQRFGK